MLVAWVVVVHVALIWTAKWLDECGERDTNGKTHSDKDDTD